MPKISNNAKVTAKGQTTIPIAVRKALGVGPDDLLRFTILDGGKVEVEKANTDSGDPVIAAYLSFLQQDLVANPQKLSVLEHDALVTKLLSDVETEDFDLS